MLVSMPNGDWLKLETIIRISTRQLFGGGAEPQAVLEVHYLYGDEKKTNSTVFATIELAVAEKQNMVLRFNEYRIICNDTTVTMKKD